MGTSLLGGLWLAIYALHSASAQTQTSTATTSSTSSAYRELFSIPSSADDGQPVLPTVENPQAVDAQTVCPGYKAANVQQQQYGVTAILALAGPACNTYGNDINTLDLTVQQQSADRLNIEIKPSYIGSNNATWFEPPDFITKPAIDADAAQTVPMNDLDFVWGNDPTFWFSISRKSNNETLFTTQGMFRRYSLAASRSAVAIAVHSW